jgi:hypothetical protein
VKFFTSWRKTQVLSPQEPEQLNNQIIKQQSQETILFTRNGVFLCYLMFSGGWAKASPRQECHPVGTRSDRQPSYLIKLIKRKGAAERLHLM